MAQINISHLTPLLQGLCERMTELKKAIKVITTLKKEIEALHLKVELTRDLWQKIEDLYQQEGWDSSKKPEEKNQS